MGNVYTKNFDVLIENISALSEKGLTKLEIVANEITDEIQNELLKNIAVEDEHTLSVLAEMGHPYATGEYANISDKSISREGKVGSIALPHAEPLIHKQSGRLSEGVKKLTIVNGNRVIMAAYVNESEVPYIKYLVYGTSKMIPRPVFVYTWNKIRDRIITRLKYGLSKALSARNQSNYKA